MSCSLQTSQWISCVPQLWSKQLQLTNGIRSCRQENTFPHFLNNLVIYSLFWKETFQFAYQFLLRTVGWRQKCLKILEFKIINKDVKCVIQNIGEWSSCRMQRMRHKTWLQIYFWFCFNLGWLSYNWHYRKTFKM